MYDLTKFEVRSQCNKACRLMLKYYPTNTTNQIIIRRHAIDLMLELIHILAGTNRAEFNSRKDF